MTVADLQTASGETISTRGRTCSREDVLAVIRECDDLGKPAFLRRHGFKDSVRYHLRHNGRSYPSKAVLGVALGLASDDFFGGARETVRLLGRLGFHVRNSITGEVVDKLGLDAIRHAILAAGFDDPAPAWPQLPVTPAAYFLSGSNRPAEIAGLAKVGADIGATVTELGEPSLRELENLAGSDVLVFLDSGAFSEVAFGPSGVEVVKPITDLDWLRTLAVYERLAHELNGQLWAVAPDMVGSQEETLRRLWRYTPQLRQLLDLGARVLVGVQKGDRTQAAFSRQVDELLGQRWIPALPCKKAATTPGELSSYLEERQPRHCHLLGLGVNNRQVMDYVAPFAGTSTSLSMDSCWLTANVGRKPKRRRYTLANDMAAQVLKGLGRYSVGLRVQSALYTVLSPMPANVQLAMFHEEDATT